MTMIDQLFTNMISTDIYTIAFEVGRDNLRKGVDGLIMIILQVDNIEIMWEGESLEMGLR